MHITSDYTENPNIQINEVALEINCPYYNKYELDNYVSSRNVNNTDFPELESRFIKDDYI